MQCQRTATSKCPELNHLSCPEPDSSPESLSSADAAPLRGEGDRFVNEQRAASWEGGSYARMRGKLGRDLQRTMHTSGCRYLTIIFAFRLAFAGSRQRASFMVA
jgi:hypothetical protein